jgi:hypothetical protein
MDKKKQAKYEALNEAADHLDLAWTDDSDEREFFGLLVKLGENKCFKCGKMIEKASELSIEHKKDWLDVDPQLFWAEDNIAYSHRGCNKADHLDLAWTDDSDEREAGQKLSTRLRREAERLKEIGDGTAGDATGEPFFIKSRV